MQRYVRNTCTRHTKENAKTVLTDADKENAKAVLIDAETRVKRMHCNAIPKKTEVVFIDRLPCETHAFLRHTKENAIAVLTDADTRWNTCIVTPYQGKHKSRRVKRMHFYAIPRKTQ